MPRAAAIHDVLLNLLTTRRYVDAYPCIFNYVIYHGWRGGGRFTPYINDTWPPNEVHKTVVMGQLYLMDAYDYDPVLVA